MTTRVGQRLAARFRDPSLREITPALGRRNRHSTENARRVIGWRPRPIRETLVDCADSLLAQGAVPTARCGPAAPPPPHPSHSRGRTSLSASR
jgi:hypothetical protein